jgi:hypothetical protein
MRINMEFSNYCSQLQYPGAFRAKIATWDMSTRNSYIVMVAASVAVITLIGWALSRSFSAPVTSSIPVETASPAVPPPSGTPGEPVQSPEEAAVVRIGPEELRQKTVRGEVTVIDVRDAADFQLGHLPGSLHVPLATVEAQIAYLPKGKPIVAYCT